MSARPRVRSLLPIVFVVSCAAPPDGPPDAGGGSDAGSSGFTDWTSGVTATFDEVKRACLFAAGCLPNSPSVRGPFTNSFGHCVEYYSNQLGGGVTAASTWPFVPVKECAATATSCETFSDCLLAKPPFFDCRVEADGSNSCQGNVALSCPAAQFGLVGLKTDCAAIGATCDQGTCIASETCGASAKQCSASGNAIVNCGGGAGTNGPVTPCGLLPCVKELLSPNVACEATFGPCTSGYGCKGDRFYSCSGNYSREVGLDCAASGRTCVTDPAQNGAPRCTAGGVACSQQGTAGTCAGSVLTSCVAGETVTVDCASAGLDCVGGFCVPPT